MGYLIKNGIKPDPDQVKPVLQLSSPKNAEELKHFIGLFSDYAQWIANFSEKIKPLILADHFPLRSYAEEAFQRLKAELAGATLLAINKKIPFLVGTDALTMQYLQP